MPSRSPLFIRFLFIILIASLGGGFILYLLFINPPRPLERKEEVAEGRLIFESLAFQDKEKIPTKYTCDGLDISPPLRIEGIQPGAKSLAILVEDIDSPGGVWVHWLLWNISPHTREIKEGEVPEEAVEGKNSWGRIGYGGPCPPFGTHRYYFRLYVLSEKLDLERGATKKEFLEAIRGKVIDKAEFYGTYER